MNENQRSVDELKKIRVDCMYGKKKHYNARDRYSSYHKCLGIAVVGLTALIGTSVFYSISESDVLTARVITGMLTVTVAVFAALQTYLNFEKRALSHKVVADRYLFLMKKSQRLISYYEDGNKTIDDVIAEMEVISNEIRDIQKDESETSPQDYQKTQEGVNKGEETYTDRERET